MYIASADHIQSKDKHLEFFGDAQSMLRRSSNTSKRIQLAVALLVCLVDAQANMTGKELLAFCRGFTKDPPPDYFSAGACYGYIIGVTDTHQGIFRRRSVFQAE
jgi:hypothetical protein